jgi:hypothetical protein
MALYAHAAAESHGLPLDLPGAVAMVTLLVLVISAATADRTGRAGAGVLAAASVVWLLVNGPMEGSVLYPVTEGHGLTAADLVGLTGLGIAGWRLWRWHHHPPR